MEHREGTLSNRTIGQGGVESTFQWDVFMRHLIAQLLPRWRSIKVGVFVKGVGWISHLPWADNVCQLACFIANLHVMAQDVARELHKRNLHWKPSSVE